MLILTRFGREIRLLLFALFYSINFSLAMQWLVITNNPNNIALLIPFHYRLQD